MPVVVNNRPTPKASKDRSPSFPFIPLKIAIERLEAFEKKFGRHPTPFVKVGLAWGLKEKSSQADQILAALRSFGLVRYEGMGKERQASLTEEGRTYIRAQQDSVKRQILKQSALRPKIIRKFWTTWGPDRPPDEVALDQLTLKNSFTDAGAKNFLSVYDATIAYAGLTAYDKFEGIEEDVEGESEEVVHVESPYKSDDSTGIVDKQQKKKVHLMAGERELTTGLLSKDANFRLIVSGNVGVKEIERLIKKLELDKEILAEQDTGEEEPD
jgi:hypothetical protein